ncbi:MAG: hypothetical protein GY910_21150 [bacterium]|nr:hypothetical protein [Deltaproteobacteria bacterium]MCP4907492.1 hypothetical protein [bacterium]
MGRALRQHRNDSRNGERVPLRVRLFVTTLDGSPAAPLAHCTNIGLGGLRISAAVGPKPGTPVRIEVRLPTERVFTSRGHVAWSKQTLHPSLFGPPRGRDDDAVFGIAFDGNSPSDLLPIARLFAARDQERARARRMRRLRGHSIHA